MTVLGESTPATLPTPPMPGAGEEHGYEDYFSFEETKTWYLPDGKQYIQFKVMNEGDKALFQKSTNNDMVVEKASGNARLRVDQSEERQQLLLIAVVGWHMVKKNKDDKFEPVTFSGQKRGSEFFKWMQTANPRLIEDLEFEVRKANPWLVEDISVEEYDKQIANLEELRAAAVKREEEKGSSSSK